MQYHFYSTGALNNSINIYSDASCTGNTVFSDAEHPLGLTFVDQGAEPLPTGPTGNRLTVSDSIVSSITADIFTNVTNNTLCLSNNLQLTSNGYSFFYTDTLTDVDYSNNCLTRIN